jgi:hypothetical protein
MNNNAHAPVINTHAECGCAHYHWSVALRPLLIRGSVLACRKTAMIQASIATCSDQRFDELRRALSGVHINNGSIAGLAKLGSHNIQNLHRHG